MLSKFLHGIDPALLRLAGYAKPYKWQLLMSCFWMVIVAGTTAITSKLLGMLTEQGFYERDTSMIVTAPVALIVITLFYAVALVMSNYTLTKVSQSILVTVRTQMYSNMLRWPMEQYQNLSTKPILLWGERLRPRWFSYETSCKWRLCSVCFFGKTGS